MSDDDPELTAQVVMRPRGGPLTGHEEITAATVGRYLPDPGDVALAAAWFEAAGFAVRDRAGLGFAIVAPATTYERIFATRPRLEGSDAGVRILLPDGGLALPTERLPGDVAGVVQAVEFQAPPDFGPPGP